MYNLLTKYGQLFAFGLGVLITLLFLFSVFGGLEEFNMLDKENAGTTSIFNIGLYAAIFLCILGAAAILIFGILHTISNPKGAMKFLIGLGVLVVLFLIFYSMTQPVTSGKLQELMSRFDISQGQHKFISGALWCAVTLALLSAVTFLFSEVRNLFK